MTGAEIPRDTDPTPALKFSATDAEIPSTVDWRSKGYVTPVKNQGHCGSCWAFSTTGALEGQHFNATSNLVSLSEQNLVDCSKDNEGCTRGWPKRAFQYIIDNKGIDTEESYPYEGVNKTCQFKKADVGATMSCYYGVTMGNESDLTQAIAQVGPISVCIDAARHPSFQHYNSGVYYEPTCSTVDTDHCVLVVGYGVSDGKDMYIVKNSWGTSWGMEGYMYMSRNRDNNCAIASYASYPIVPSKDCPDSAVGTALAIPLILLLLLLNNFLV